MKFSLQLAIATTIAVCALWMATPQHAAASAAAAPISTVITETPAATTATWDAFATAASSQEATHDRLLADAGTAVESAPAVLPDIVLPSDVPVSRSGEDTACTNPNCNCANCKCVNCVCGSVTATACSTSSCGSCSYSVSASGCHNCKKMKAGKIGHKAKRAIRKASRGCRRCG